MGVVAECSVAVHLDLGCGANAHMEILGHSRYHGMADTDYWSLLIRVSCL